MSKFYEPATMHADEVISAGTVQPGKIAAQEYARSKCNSNHLWRLAYYEPRKIEQEMSTVVGLFCEKCGQVKESTL